MIRVHLIPEFSMQPREFATADDWIIDAESGNLTVTSGKERRTIHMDLPISACPHTPADAFTPGAGETR